MFVNLNDVWGSNIKRNSNFQFELTEKKSARDLFSLYGLSSSIKYHVEFIDKTTIGLAIDNSDPKNSNVRLIKID